MGATLYALEQQVARGKRHRPGALEILSAEHLLRVDNLKAAVVDWPHLPAVMQGIENDAALTRRTAPKPPEKRSLAANDHDEEPPPGVAAFDAVSSFISFFVQRYPSNVRRIRRAARDLLGAHQLSSLQAIPNGRPGPASDPQRMKNHNRMMTGIGTPSSHRAIERMTRPPVEYFCGRPTSGDGRSSGPQRRNAASSTSASTGIGKRSRELRALFTEVHLRSSSRDSSFCRSELTNGFASVGVSAYFCAKLFAPYPVAKANGTPRSLRISAIG